MIQKKKNDKNCAAYLCGRVSFFVAKNPDRTRVRAWGAKKWHKIKIKALQHCVFII
nr:MAG TPA: hypothetical protein [Caudoviricetes sp.]